MNLTALRTFLVIVESGNLNKAAERLNVTQSTVTARLDALEANLGQQLLVRSRKGAQLTRAGFIFRPYAETLIRGWEQSQNAVGLPKGYSGIFSFACEYGLWESVGKKLFDQIRIEHMELAHEAWPGSPDEIATWLANGLTDAALTMEPVTGYRLISLEATRERLVLVTSNADVKWGDNFDYIHVDLGPEFRRQYANETGFETRAAVTYASSSWALDHLLYEGGSAYMPMQSIAKMLEKGTLRTVSGAPELSRGVYFTIREANQTRFPWLENFETWLSI
ncbi:MAG: LysR family transcriptional regulator [Pseudomonadota bacterium]